MTFGLVTLHSMHANSNLELLQGHERRISGAYHGHGHSRDR